MDNAYCGSMQQAQRRVYDMQRRAQAALGRSAEERGEEPNTVPAEENENCARKTPVPRVSGADTERLLLLLLAVMILRSGRGSAALAAALLYICM